MDEAHADLRLTPVQAARIQAEVDAGQAIAAIKLYREFTGVDLATAKAAIEALASAPPVMAPNEPDRPKPSPTALEAEVADMLRQGAKIAAIKRYREATGADLKAAKEAVEALGRRLGIRDKSCFVATAVFEDSEAPTVLILRRWRDEQLATHAAGRFFIAWYRRFGPWLASLPRHSRMARQGLKCALNQLARWL